MKAGGSGRPPTRSSEEKSGHAPRKLNLKELEHANANTGLSRNLILTAGFVIPALLAMLATHHL